MKKSIICIGMVLHIGVLALADVKPLHNVWFTPHEISVISNLNSHSAEVMNMREIILNNIISNSYKCGITYNWFSVLFPEWKPCHRIENLECRYDENTISEIDNSFGSIGVRSFNYILPKCFTNAVVQRFPNDLKRQFISFKYRRVCWEYYNGDFNRDTIFTMDEITYMFKTDVCFNKKISDFVFWQKRVLASYLVAVKRWRRQNGLSIISSEGVNPIEPYMDKMTSALNAPMLKGFNECLSDIGLNNITIDFSDFPTASEIEKIQSDIKADLKDMNNDMIKFYLRVGLGADGYNELVNWYNGGN